MSHNKNHQIIHNQITSFATTFYEGKLLTREEYTTLTLHFLAGMEAVFKLTQSELYKTEADLQRLRAAVKELALEHLEKANQA